MSAWMFTGPCSHSLRSLFSTQYLTGHFTWLSYKWGLGTLQREVQAKVKSPVPLYEYFRGVPSAHALGAGFCSYNRSSRVSM